jgi:hypothetical protein
MKFDPEMMKTLRKLGFKRESTRQYWMPNRAFAEYFRQKENVVLFATLSASLGKEDQCSIGIGFRLIDATDSYQIADERFVGLLASELEDAVDQATEIGEALFIEHSCRD